MLSAVNIPERRMGSWFATKENTGEMAEDK